MFTLSPDRPVGPIGPSFVLLVLPALASLLVLSAGCDEQPACAKHKAKIESCNRVFNRDVCSTPEDRCITACYAKLRCAEYEDIDNDRYPARLEQCVAPCGKKFTCDDGDTIEDWWRCDASQDCVDGSDELGCKYFECKSGQLVRKTARCDGYAHCSDGSDEPEESCRNEE